MFKLSPKFIRYLIAVSAIGAVVPLLALTHMDLKRRQLAGRNAPGEDYYLPRKEVLRALSFGYNEFGADLLWVRTIAYFADHWRDKETQHLHRHLYNILALDEHFKNAYRFGSAMLMSRGKRQTNTDVMNAIHLLERGHSLFPNEYRFPFSIGTYYMYELRSVSKLEKANWQRIAADWIQRAVLVGADIPWLPTLAANLFTQQGERELAIRHLQEIYLVTKDPEMKLQIAGKLKSMQAAHLADELKAQTEQFALVHENSPISFVHPDLFVFVHLPPVGPFSLEE
ncbi:MAG: hypothetical protein V1754_04130 [Pseudomonadota bacterium]